VTVSPWNDARQSPRCFPAITSPRTSARACLPSRVPPGREPCAHQVANHETVGSKFPGSVSLPETTAAEKSSTKIDTRSFGRIGVQQLTEFVRNDFVACRSNRIGQDWIELAHARKGEGSRPLGTAGGEIAFTLASSDPRWHGRRAISSGAFSHAPRPYGVELCGSRPRSSRNPDQFPATCKFTLADPVTTGWHGGHARNSGRRPAAAALQASPPRDVVPDRVIQAATVAGVGRPS